MRLWRTARRIPLHRWLSQRPVISPVPHRPVRRVSPPLREGRPLPPACPVLDTGSFRRKSQMRLWRVADAPLACRRCAFGVSQMRLWRTGIQAGPGMGRSARANLGVQFAKTLSGRSADNPNPRTRNQPTNQTTDQPKEENPNNYRAAAPGEPVEPRGNPAD